MKTKIFFSFFIVSFLFSYSVFSGYFTCSRSKARNLFRLYFSTFYLGDKYVKLTNGNDQLVCKKWLDKIRINTLDGDDYVSTLKSDRYGTYFDLGFGNDIFNQNIDKGVLANLTIDGGYGYDKLIINKKKERLVIRGNCSNYCKIYLKDKYGNPWRKFKNVTLKSIEEIHTLNGYIRFVKDNNSSSDNGVDNKNTLTQLDNETEYNSSANINLIKIKPGISWYWKLSKPINSSDINLNYKLFDIDLFDNTKETIQKLKQKGKIVICYFSAGSWENWRTDANKFPKSVLGKTLDGWAGERWLDISRYNLFSSIVEERIKLAKQKGCDGIEPDNLDVYDNDSGFSVSKQDSINYFKFLANTAHKYGLVIALKNSPDIVNKVVNLADFAVVEQCFQYNECNKYSSFINNNKAVLEVEYEINKSKFCSKARNLKFSSTKACYDLNGFWDPCLVNTTNTTRAFYPYVNGISTRENKSVNTYGTRRYNYGTRRYNYGTRKYNYSF